MNAFELLKADHKKVAELFDQLDAATGNAKLDVFDHIKSELELHTHIEETIFYPALEKPEETHDLTLEAYEEHDVVKSLLGQLSKAKSADDEWQAKAKVLRDTVEHHVQEEEKELFAKAKAALSDKQIEALGEQMSAEKARLQGRLVAKLTKQSMAAKKKAVVSNLADVAGLGQAAATKKVASKRRTTKKAAKTTSAKKRSPARKSGSKAATRTAKVSSSRSHAASTTKRATKRSTRKKS